MVEGIGVVKYPVRHELEYCRHTTVRMGLITYIMVSLFSSSYRCWRQVARLSVANESVGVYLGRERLSAAELASPTFGEFF